MKRSILIVLIFISLAIAVDASQLISYQGRVGQSGQSVLSGNITVYIYDQASGGSLIWSDTYTDAISNGYFDLMLGNNSALNLVYGTHYWLDMAVNSENINWSGGADRIEFESGVGEIESIATNNTVYIYTNVTINGSMNVTKIIVNNITITEVINATSIIVNNITLTEWLNATSIIVNNITLTEWLNATSIIVNNITVLEKLNVTEIVTNNITVNGNVNVSGNISIGDRITFRLGGIIENTVVGLISVLDNLDVDGNITTTGNVGIGTINPQEKLHVNGTIRTNITSCSGGLVTDGSGNIQCGAIVGGLWTNSSGNATYTSGRVGIGTLSPVTTLDVNGSISFKDDLIHYGNSHFTIKNTAQDKDIKFNINNGGSDTEVMSLNGTDTSVSMGTGSLSMVIDSSGNIGIGTANPNQKLQVVGSINVSGTVYAGNFSSNSPLQLQTAGVTRIYVNDANGYVGIGTTAPGEKLTVLGNTNITGNLSLGSGKIAFNSSSNNFIFNNGSTWQEFGGSSSGVPYGAIMPFYLESCPTGWIPADGTSSTPDLRGQFLRGLNTFDNGTTNRTDGKEDPDGASRTIGDWQNEAFKSHSHSLGNSYNLLYAGGGYGWVGSDRSMTTVSSTQSTGGTETHPKNVALIYCMKN